MQDKGLSRPDRQTLENKRLDGQLKQQQQNKKRMKQKESTSATSLGHRQRLMETTQHNQEMQVKGEIMKEESAQTADKAEEPGMQKNRLETADWEKPDCSWGNSYADKKAKRHVGKSSINLFWATATVHQHD